MNDRFKFRVWTGHHYAEDFRFIMSMNGDLKQGTYVSGFDKPYQDCIVEQCTGLKDKNGNLIYEGDIVKIGNGSINGEVMESELEVKWCDKLGRYNLPNWTSDTPDWSHYIEIIGNIHEQKDAA